MRSPGCAFNVPGAHEIMLVGTINGTCPDTVHRLIVVDAPLESSFVVEPDSICVGEVITFAHQLSHQSIEKNGWDFGDGDAPEILDNVVQHAYGAAGIMPVKLTLYARACPASWYFDTVFVFDLPVVNLGGDSILCLGKPALLLNNLNDVGRFSKYL